MTPVRLIWPPRELAPNWRGHWSKKAKATSAYRSICRLMARKADLRAVEGRIAVELTFCPPDRRKRDLDNLQASMKAACDGIADALGVDDSWFRPRSDWGDVDPKGEGFVLVTLEPWERPA